MRRKFTGGKRNKRQACFLGPGIIVWPKGRREYALRKIVLEMRRNAPEAYERVTSMRAAQRRPCQALRFSMDPIAALLVPRGHRKRRITRVRRMTVGGGAEPKLNPSAQGKPAPFEQSHPIDARSRSSFSLSFRGVKGDVFAYLCKGRIRIKCKLVVFGPIERTANQSAALTESTRWKNHWEGDPGEKRNAPARTGQQAPQGHKKKNPLQSFVPALNVHQDPWPI